MFSNNFELIIKHKSTAGGRLLLNYYAFECQLSFAIHRIEFRECNSIFGFVIEFSCLPLNIWTVVTNNHRAFKKIITLFFTFYTNDRVYVEAYFSPGNNVKNKRLSVKLSSDTVEILAIFS